MVTTRAETSNGTGSSSNDNIIMTTTILPQQQQQPSPPTAALNVTALRAPMFETHASGDNLTLAWRLQQLKTLHALLHENWDVLLDALRHDLGKDATEAACTELCLVDQELGYIQKNLKTWMSTRQVPASPAVFPSFNRLEKKPLLPPATLIITPFNYPVSLALQPLMGSLCAGNPTVLKPTELAPTVALVLQRLLHQYYAPGIVRVVVGGVAETQALLAEPWGLVFFTGSERVGKLVAAAAAQTLTPCVLELGGKCPCIVDETAPAHLLDQVASRIIWSKTMNCGQTCAAIDYLLVHESLLQRLVPCLLQALEKQYGSDIRESELGRIVHESHAQRLQDLIVEVEEYLIADDVGTGTSAPPCRILCGGSKSCDVKSKYIAPTIILNPPVNSRMMQEEIFGPILPIWTFTSRSEAIERVQRMSPGTPLCLYAFTNSDNVFCQYTNACRAGSAMRNDALCHLANPCVPFGGLGTSGYGTYHGKYSFETFSQSFYSCHRIMGIKAGDKIRCHPFGGVDSFKSRALQFLLVHAPAMPVLHLPWLAAMLLVVLTCWSIPALHEIIRVKLLHVVTSLLKWMKHGLLP
jgi:acyl-CoA reductase-like NAD-dependent aldehyde dehydrogenase